MAGVLEGELCGMKGEMPEPAGYGQSVGVGVDVTVRWENMGRTYLCHGTGRISPWLAMGRTVATGCAELYWDVQKGRDPI